MPTLNWMGKDKVISHHRDVPYRVLERIPEKSALDSHESDCGNMIIHGDNLEALKALLPEYEGKVDCIYIDPPYNTGKEGWVYNDNVNDPRIKKWIGEVVGKEGEDFSRHDKWLCMMYPRLRLLDRLLKEDGAIVISIGLHEVNNLVQLCNEIFAPKKVQLVTVQTSGGKPSDGFNVSQEYLIFICPRDFSPNPLSFSGGKSRSPFEGMTLSTYDKTQRPNQTYPIFVDKNTMAVLGCGKSLKELVDEGVYTGNLEEYEYTCTAPDGACAVWPITSKGKECVWRLAPDRFLGDWEKGYIKVSPNTKSTISNDYSIQYLPSGVIKKIQSGDLEVVGKEDSLPTLRFGENSTVGGQIPTIWLEKEFRTTNGTAELSNIFSDSIKAVFDYPKPVGLVMSVIKAVARKDALVLDSFAGSGTTGHAVQLLNKQDHGSRRYILVEMMDYADSVTAERQRRVIAGYTVKSKQVETIFKKKLTNSSLKNVGLLYENAKLAATEGAAQGLRIDGPKIDDGSIVVEVVTEKKEAVPGIDSGFSFFELGQSLFSKDGLLNDGINRLSVMKYVWHTETKEPFVDCTGECPYLMGEVGHTVYYLCYVPGEEICLTTQLLSTFTRREQTTVVYADRCLIDSDTLARLGIVFKQVPREIVRM